MFAWAGVAYLCLTCIVCMCDGAGGGGGEGMSRDAMLLRSSSGSRPAQITSAGPGRVIGAAYLRVLAILTVDALSCTDEVNSGKSHYLLLVVKSKPITKEVM